jgi:hypothetical protein
MLLEQQPLINSLRHKLSYIQIAKPKFLNTSLSYTFVGIQTPKSSWFKHYNEKRRKLQGEDIHSINSLNSPVTSLTYYICLCNLLPFLPKNSYLTVRLHKLSQDNSSEYTVAVEEYRWRFPMHRIPNHRVFSKVFNTLRKCGTLPSSHVSSEWACKQDME